MTLKLALGVLMLGAFAAPQAIAQEYNSGYNSSDTPQARAQQSKLAQQRAQAEGVHQTGVASGNIPDLQVFAAVSLAEVYTSNASGSGGNTGRYDFYTEPGLRLGATENSQRLAASLDYSLTGQYHARNHHLDQIINRLSAAANAELLRETLFLDAHAFATPMALSRVGSLTAEDGTPTGGNYRNSYGYAARPTLMHKFGSLVETDLWFSQSGVFFKRPPNADTNPLPGFFVPPTDSRTSAVGARIGSLEDFVRLNWAINAMASDTYQTGHNSQKVRSATASGSYALTDTFSIIGTGGYGTYHASFLLSKDLDGPILLGGVQFISSQVFKFFVEAGTQNNFPTYIGNLSWQLTPLTSFTASATDQIQTPQQQLLGNLQNPITGPSTGGIGTPGAPIPGSGVASEDGLAFDNSIYRYRQYRADLTHAVDRMQYDLGVFATLRDRLAGISTSILNPHEKNYGIRATVGRDLRRDLHSSVTFQISKANEFNGTDRLLQGSFNLNYNVSQTMSLRFNASVLNRNSDRLVGFQNGSVTDFRALVGVTKSF